MTVQKAINVLLGLAVLLSALWLVHTQYEARRLYVAVEDAKRERSELVSAYDKLEVQKRANAAPDRVERLAKERLDMHSIKPEQTEYVRVHERSALVEEE